jgi:hypothetical protein
MKMMNVLKKKYEVAHTLELVKVEAMAEQAVHSFVQLRMILQQSHVLIHE